MRVGTFHAQQPTTELCTLTLSAGDSEQASELTSAAVLNGALASTQCRNVVTLVAPYAQVADNTQWEVGFEPPLASLIDSMSADNGSFELLQPPTYLYAPEDLDLEKQTFSALNIPPLHVAPLRGAGLQPVGSEPVWLLDGDDCFLLTTAGSWYQV